MEDPHTALRPNYLPALAFVGVLIGFQNLAIRSDSTPDPFLRPALSVTQAFRLPPEMQPAEVSPASMAHLSSLVDAAEPDLSYAGQHGFQEPAEFAGAEGSYDEHGSYHEPAHYPDEDHFDESRFTEFEGFDAALSDWEEPPESPELSDEVGQAILEAGGIPPEAAPSPPVAAPVVPEKKPPPRITRPSPPSITAARDYTVQKGDSLWAIAKRFDFSVPELLARNPHLTDSDHLRVGMNLKIGAIDSLEHRVEAGDSLWAISRFYGVAVGQILTANDLKSPAIHVGQALSIPTASMTDQQLASVVRRRQEKGKGFVLPVFGRTTDHFGMRRHPILGRFIPHRGVDIAARSGSAIRATQDGVVSFSGKLKGYGKLIEVRHKNGYTSRYGHCSALLRKKGQRVKKGDTIARVGMSGLATAPHVHFEIRKGGTPLDPMKLL
jgi:murein DD-endopeptidase MepM/ murein hydrolase activator NlpD